MKSLKDYREGKLEAYKEALRIIQEMKTYEAKNVLEVIESRLNCRIEWNKEELIRLDKQQ